MPWLGAIQLPEQPGKRLAFLAIEAQPVLAQIIDGAVLLLAALRAASSRPLRSKIAAYAGPPLALRPSGCTGPAPAMDGPP